MAIVSRGVSSPISPPPSPIPTGKGSRSAANPMLSRHLTTRLTEIPKLSLPKRIQPHRSSPTDVDLGSLMHREPDVVKRVLMAAGSGVFRITGHGISVDVVRSELMESSVMVAGSEEFVWRPLIEGAAEPALEIIGRENWQSFSQKMENIWNELERIANEIAKVLYNNSNKQTILEGIEKMEPVLSIHRYNQDLVAGGNPSISSKENYQTRGDYALSLHLPLEQCEFRVHSRQGTLSLSASPQTLIITIGKELEHWSGGQFKSAYGEPIFERNFSTDRLLFSIELKCSPSVPCLDYCKTNKTISIEDQIFLMIAIPILYKMLMFIFY